MAIKVTCQQCGKSSVFADADAGLTALCSACGARYTIPAQFVDTLQVLPPGPNAPQPDSTPLPTLANLEPGETPPPLPAPPPPPLRGLMWGLLTGAAAMIVLIAVVLFATMGTSWETANAAQIKKLKAQADALVVENRLSDAYEVYRKLEDFVGARNLRDPALRDEFTKARTARERIFETILSQNRTKIADNSTSKPSDPIPPPTTLPTRTATTSPTQNVDNIASKTSNSDPTTRAADPPKPDPVAVKPADPIKPPDTQPGLDTRPAITVRPPSNTGTDPANPDRKRLGIRHVHQQWDEGVISDAQIGKSIQRAVDYLLGRFRDGMIDSGERRADDAYNSGLNALCVYALLQASYAIKDERLSLKGQTVREMIDKMKKSPMEQGHVTYARGIRATALALVNRPEDREVLKADVAYLLNSHLEGSYTYMAVNRSALGPAGRRNPNAMQFMGDNSNAQYGLLGVWSGAEVGIEVNTPYWQAVDNHWTRSQNDDGSWSYTGYGGRGQGRLSMTLAGLASLFVTHDYLDAPKFGTSVGRDPFSNALKKGLAHLESGDTCVSVEGGYSLYGLERVGLASGFKYFGQHDWYRELAAKLVDNQLESGAWRPTDGWGGTDVGTAYNLLFLARGRHPILMNKLRYEGHWANRPRDVANLARFGSHEVERPLNWQVVSIERNFTDWLDSPILYISSHIPPKFTDKEIDKIRSYAQAGGMIFTQADGNGIPANAAFEELAKKLFPLYEMKDLPEDHEIYKILFKPSPHPRLRYITNGSRVLLVHSPSDISQWWQLRQEKSRRSIFELGVNMFLYAAGKGDLRNRLASPCIAPPPRGPDGGMVRVVRLKYAGNWDPEPMAWTRFARYFQGETDVGVEVVTTDLSAAGEIAMEIPTIAHLTGTATYSLNAEQIQAIKKFVERGGVLVIEPTGGMGDFTDSARAALLAAFGKQPDFVPRDHPILTGARQPGTEDCSAGLLRPFAKSRTAGNTGRLEQITFGQGRVLFTPLDLTTGLLGANTWGIYGFDPDYACALVKNIILWTAGGKRD